MKRTTFSISPSLLKAVKELARQEGVAMRKVMSDLLQLGLKARSKYENSKHTKKFNWHTQPMKSKIDYDDKEQLFKILDSGK